MGRRRKSLLDSLPINDVSMIGNGQDSDREVTEDAKNNLDIPESYNVITRLDELQEQGLETIEHQTAINRAGAGNVSVSTAASRRLQVEYRWLAGMANREISRELAIPESTVARDIEYIRATNKQRPDLEQYRSAVVRTMLDVAQRARERHEADGSTVEGRLVIDAMARLSKVLGLDETLAESEVQGALSDFLRAARARVDALGDGT